MGAAAAVAISLTALAWYAFFALLTPHKEMPGPARRALLLYLLVLLLWTVGTLASWLLTRQPRPGPWAALPAGLAVPGGCLLFAWAYRAWPLPRPAYSAVLGGLAALGLGGFLVATRGLGPSHDVQPLTVLPAVYGLCLLGLAAWLWAQSGRARLAPALLGVGALGLAALLCLEPLRGYRPQLGLAAIAAGLGGHLALLGRLPTLTLPQHRSAGYVLLGGLAAVLYALLAYGAHPLAAYAGAALILAGALILSGVVLAFPGLGESLSQSIERTTRQSQYEARRMVEEVAVAAPAVLDLEPLVAMILERTLRTLDIRWGLLALWDPARQELHAVVVRGLPEVTTSARWHLGHPLTAWLLEGRGDDRSQGLPYSQPAGGLPTLDTAWIVPIRLRDEPVGVFLYGPHVSAEPYNATERSILDLLANETAAAVANARLFNQVARARREWLQTFDALSDGVFLHDREGRILRANRALAHLASRSFDQIIGRPWFELIPAGPDPRQVCSASLRAGQGRGFVEYDLSYEGHRTLHVTVSPLAQGDEFCVHVVRDVTEERALQLQLAQAEKLAAIGEMLSGVAHELNNPLTTIIGFSELLQDANVPEQVRADLQRISRQAKRSSRIVQSLLTFARQSRIQVTEIDVNTLLKQTVEFMQPQFKSHRIQVALELDPQLPRVLADAGQLQQVFLNLFSNAVQALSARRGARVLRVESRATPGDVRVAVADNGPGIPQDLLQRIFDPFFTTKDVGEGTGLGLSISYGIVREHGGRIWAESELGQGATFFVQLPIRHGGVAAEAPPAAPRPGGRRILIVEDEEPIVALLLRVLEPAGHQVLTAADGEQGLAVLAEALARGHTPDLIVADLKMPGLDGRGFYERVRRDHPHLAGRFLFISGDTIRPESQSFLDNCGLPYLRKPFSVKEIQEALSKALAEDEP